MWLLFYFIVATAEAVMNSTSKFSIDELLTSSFPRKISNDIDLVPWKADFSSVHRAIPRQKLPLLSPVRKTTTEQDKRVTKVGLGLSSDPRKRVSRAATSRKELLWDYGVVPYEIDGNFSSAYKALFKRAMRHWENATCIKFVERNPLDHPNYIFFTEGSCGCACSFVGKLGHGRQAVSIGKQCGEFGIVAHELGHAIGFWHEHSRPDRDKYVKIAWDRIKEGEEHSFIKHEEVNSFGLGYDYDSIMHYGPYYVSKLQDRDPNLDTTEPIEKLAGFGRGKRLSAGDIAQANLLYKCAECGRTYQNKSASFSHPATLHGSGVSCEWRISATNGEKIILNITQLDIHWSENCRTDYLEIRDGYWQKSPLIGKLCGERKASDGIIMSSGARLTITLVTTARSVNNKGFAASYEAVCGGDIFVTEKKGYLDSPNFPENYEPNKSCTWNLKVQDGYQIFLKFLSFEVENHDNCTNDYVEIRDGHGLSSPVIGTYCGYKLPSEITSTGNTLSVKFVSNGSVQKTGFSASFVQNECSAPNVMRCEQICTNIVGGYECSCREGYELHSDGFRCEKACGGVIEALNGTLTSPSFPEVYPRNKSCIWELVAPPQYKILLNFTHFDVDDSYINFECQFDSVKVHSVIIGDDHFSEWHGDFCGTKKPPLIIGETNALRVQFTSDGIRAVRKPGDFEGGASSEPNASLMGLSGISAYRPILSRFGFGKSTVQRTGFAAVFFTDFDECSVDNGGCQDGCQNTIGSFVCTCFNGLSLHENGRDCMQEDGCKFEITAPYGQIQSPNYPDYYPSTKDCVWHFTTTPGHRILLSSTEFEEKEDEDCAFDHIVIYDGDSTDSRSLGKFCNYIMSSGNEMYMVFKSDGSLQSRGFRATHETECYGDLQATNQTKYFYSHVKYGVENYENKMHCYWKILAPPGHRIRLVFLVFELEEEQNCSCDYVEVLDSSYVFKICNNKVDNSKATGRPILNSREFTSSDETLKVRFWTDYTTVSKGFKASYVAYDPADSDETAEKRNLQDDDPLEND